MSQANYTGPATHIPRYEDSYPVGVVTVSNGLSSTSQVNSTKPYSINIDAMDYGYVVRIGCKSFCIESYEKVASAIRIYLVDPQSAEKAWISGDLKISDL